MSEEFVSKLEEIIPACELNFPPSPAFGPYKRFLEHAVAHPAKANVFLLEFLVLNFTKEGDIILDPMAGSGSTGVVASLNGRNAIQVDIEPKYYEWMEQAKKYVEEAHVLGKKGWIRNICGDARNLSNLLGNIDVIITSPPYEHQLHDSYEERACWKGGEIDKMKKLPVGYSSNPDNIGNMEGENYFSAMFKVYSEMFKVLKSNSLAIIVVKPYIRERRIVDLPYLTWVLLSRVGFKLERLFKLRLKMQSFWRILYYKRNPDVPLIAHEYVIVCRKGENNVS